MTPKEKAEELINKFKPLCVNVKHIGIFDGLSTVMNDDVINLMSAKQCALIVVDEILNEYWSHDCNRRNWWEEVKKEIKLLW